MTRSRRLRPNRVFEPYARDLRARRREVEAFRAMLQAGTLLAEMNDILPLVRRSRHLAAAFGFANRALVAPDVSALERWRFGVHLDHIGRERQRSPGGNSAAKEQPTDTAACDV